MTGLWQNGPQYAATVNEELNKHQLTSISVGHQLEHATGGDLPQWAGAKIAATRGRDSQADRAKTDT